MEGESGESTEPMEEVVLVGLHESELERLVHVWRIEAGNLFQRRGDTRLYDWATKWTFKKELRDKGSLFQTVAAE